MEFINLICPVCGKRLNALSGCVRCDGGHSFDIASEGYVNLLTADKKKTAQPGDNKIMVSARKSFLSKGYFEPLAERLARSVGKNCESILDSGCGTGYYGSYIKRYFDNRPHISGVDISKFAVRVAAKAGYDEAVTASVFDLPFAVQSFDTAVVVFAPLCSDELHKVIKGGGRIIRVTPAEEHLIELKRAVYGERTYINTTENAQKQLLSKNGEPLFEISDVSRLTFKKTVVSNEDILQLFEMTPYSHKTGEGQKANLNAVSELNCTFDFYITEYKKLTQAE